MTRMSNDSPTTGSKRNGGRAVPLGRTELVITLEERGPRRTTLDLVAARATSVTGTPEEIGTRLAAAMVELGPALERSGGRALAAGTADELVELGPEALMGREAASSCDEALDWLAATPAGVPVIVVVMASLVAVDEAGVVALVEAARRRAGTAVLLGGASPAAAEQMEAVEGAPATVAVGVLGPVEVHGTAPELARHPKLTALTVYLAVHPEGAASRSWAEALWPERLVPGQTIANRASELRQLLGFAPDGRPRLRRDGERYYLVDVRTDWSLARTLAAPSGDLERWRAALSLVRGRPFSGLREASWTRVEGHEAEIERILTECALRTSAALLDHGDPAGAAWAAEQGLKAVPWDERLHRALMRAGAAAGNLGQVESTLRHLAIALEIEGDPLGGVHPETARLYGQLSGRGRNGAG